MKLIIGLDQITDPEVEQITSPRVNELWRQLVGYLVTPILEIDPKRGFIICFPGDWVKQSSTCLKHPFQKKKSNQTAMKVEWRKATSKKNHGGT